MYVVYVRTMYIRDGHIYFSPIRISWFPWTSFFRTVTTKLLSTNWNTYLYKFIINHLEVFTVINFKHYNYSQGYPNIFCLITLVFYVYLCICLFWRKLSVMDNNLLLLFLTYPVSRKKNLLLIKTGCLNLLSTRT